MTTMKNVPKDLKVKSSWNIFWEEVNLISLTGLVMGNIELTKRNYLRPIITASAHATNATITITSITTIAVRAKATTINSNANTTTASTKTKHIKVKNLGYIKNVWK